MKRSIPAASVLVLALIFTLSSCTWKKTGSTETAEKFRIGSENPDYRSGATVVDDSESSTGILERATVSSGAASSLGAAINSEKEQNCEKLGTPADVQACKDLVFFKNGTEEHDYAACDKISRPRNRQICESRVSKYFVDFGSCDNVRDEETKKTCLAKNRQTETRIAEQTAASYQKSQQKMAEAAKAGTSQERVALACANLSGANLNYCYGIKVSEEIQKTGDATLCSIIPDAKTKAACKQKAAASANKATLDRAIAAKDPSICDGLALQQDKDLCKKIVTAGK